MKKLEIALSTQFSKVANKMIAGESCELTVILFHKDCYRVATSKSIKILSEASCYLRNTDAIAYGLIFPGSSQKDDGVESSCVTTAIVRRDDQAFVQYYDYKDTEKGVVFEDGEVIIIDAPFLHLFDNPLDCDGDDVKAGVDLIMEEPLIPYSEFVISRVGI